MREKSSLAIDWIEGALFLGLAATYATVVFLGVGLAVGASLLLLSVFGVIPASEVARITTYAAGAIALPLGTGICMRERDGDKVGELGELGEN